MRTTRTTNRIARSLISGRCRLQVVFGPDAGLAIDIPAAGLVVGARRGSDLVLNDPAVSSRHCAIKPIASGFEVADLGSRNGTLYEGAAITRAAVPPGATLGLGGTLLQLMPAEEVIDLPPSAATSFGGLLGSSVAMRRVYAVLERISRSGAPVLLIGGSGTGKEVCAQAVHAASPRRNGPFVVFDCTAASESLIESDLFGHVRGAFTGADRDRPGAFAAAHGGTLFLDEIGDLPPRLQPKLLRLLETGETQPLGGFKSTRYDVRILAATHRDVQQDVARGVFRGDLYYRLAVVEVHLPALRERLEDLPELLRHFLRREGAPDRDVASKNLDRMMAYAWPGNVRELRNVVTRAVLLSPTGTPFSEMPVLLGSIVAAAPSRPAARAARPFSEAKAALLEQFERDYITDLLERHGKNLAEAARVAGMERKHLYRVMVRLGLTRDAQG